QIDQLFCECLYPIRIVAGPAKFDSEIAAFRPPQLRERAPELRKPRLHSRIALRKADQHADPPQSIGLLGPRRKRPRRRRATTSVMNSRLLIRSPRRRSPAKSGAA